MGEKQTEQQSQTKQQATDVRMEDEFAKLLGKSFVPMGGADEPFATPDQFVHVQRVGAAYAASGLVPDEFRGKRPDCAIVVALAWRHKADPLAFFQHVHVIHGRPGMDAQLAIALANNSGKITGTITHEFTRDASGKPLSCTASMVLASTGEVVTGSTITWEMVDGEGWSRPHKDGSKPKWLTMPEHMFRFRAAVFMLREYLPEVLLGMYTTDELEDVSETAAVPAEPALATLRERVHARVDAAMTAAKVPDVAPPTVAPKVEPAAAVVPVPAVVSTPRPGAPVCVMDGSILDDVDEPTAEELAEHLEPEERIVHPNPPKAVAPAPAPAPAPAQAVSAAPARAPMSEREQLVARLGELCQAKGKKLPPVTRMSDEALKGYIATLSK